MLDEINTHLFVQKQPITYKFLARWKDLSSTKAKEVLAEYYDKYKREKPELFSVYTVTGKTGSVRVIKVVGQDELDSSKEALDGEVSVSIYGLNMGKIALDTMVAVNSTISKEYTTDNCVRWGVIQTTTAVRIVKGETEKPIETRPAQRTAVSEPVRQKETKPEVKKESRSDELSRLSAMYTSRKKETEKKTQPKSESVEPPRKKTKAEVKANLQKLFADSDEDEPMDVDEEPISIESQEPSNTPKPAKEVSSKPVESATKVVQPEAVEPAKPVYDEDGYLVTSKPAKRSATHPPAKKTPAPAKNAEKKGDTKKQVSLMSFFGKKK
ncbi:hypothetical protein OGAPHI_004953 [Ogataea philodendri]|uniref:DNA polymerase delta subunit 3 n=1 Tax=Ogataea philodendri TaxID=1378263 RepID=A0A9P8P2E1_9ASCO|nr:uncharacterized protein OGAPHI_004953 [Ogataea philodendri]KAH3663552.1 hypothetical protein OGAPHI_004953 [Ogataea philodendri]